MFLDYFALFMLFFVAVVIFYGIIVIHDIPYEIAVERNHPHQDAIHAAGWISLFTLHAIWPFLWIWATLWREERGWGMTGHTVQTAGGGTSLAALHEEVAALRQQVEQLSGGSIESRNTDGGEGAIPESGSDDATHSDSDPAPDTGKEAR